MISAAKRQLTFACFEHEIFTSEYYVHESYRTKKYFLSRNSAKLLCKWTFFALEPFRAILLRFASALMLSLTVLERIGPMGLSLSPIRPASCVHSGNAFYASNWTVLNVIGTGTCGRLFIHRRTVALNSPLIIFRVASLCNRACKEDFSPGSDVKWSF